MGTAREATQALTKRCRCQIDAVLITHASSSYGVVVGLRCRCGGFRPRRVSCERSILGGNRRRVAGADGERVDRGLEVAVILDECLLAVHEVAPSQLLELPDLQERCR